MTTSGSVSTIKKSSSRQLICNGFAPVIINIVPITNLPLLLGLDLPLQERDQAQLTYQQLSAGLTQNKERIYGRDPEEIFYPDYLKRANKNLDKNRA